VVRRLVRIGVGDLLEAKAEKGRIVLTPKPVIDRRLAEALDDLKAGEPVPQVPRAGGPPHGHRKPRRSRVYTVVYRAAWAVGRTSGISPRPRQV